MASIVKYTIGMLFFIVLLVGYFINKNNKEDMVRLKQAEATQKEKLKNENTEQEVVKTSKLSKIVLDKSIAELQSKMAMDYSEAKKIIESEKISPQNQAFYDDLLSRWNEAVHIASSTPKQYLAQSTKNMQMILNELKVKQTQGYCEEGLKQSLITTFDYTIDGFVEFMQSDKTIPNSNEEQGIKHAKKIAIFMEYCHWYSS